jgi:hypothetical protein
MTQHGPYLLENLDKTAMGDAPVGNLLSDGRAAKKRKRRATTAGAFAATALLIVGAFGLSGLTDGDHGEPDVASSLPAPADGTRWVGLGRVVVAVPEWWTTGETQCGAPVETTVYFDNAATIDCVDPADPATIREVSALAVMDAETGYGELVTRDMNPIGEVNGQEVLESEKCEEWFEGVCRRLFAVPSEGVVFAVTIADSGDGDYDAIRDSLRILPESMTTIPLRTAGVGGWTPTWGAEPKASSALVTALRAAGLEVVLDAPEPPSPGSTVDYMGADFEAGTLLGVSPELGSPIDEGGTVHITVAGDSDGESSASTVGIRLALTTHCGVRSATVKGELWLADPALGGHNPPPGWGENETVGRFTKTDPSHGVFVADGGLSATFRKAPPGATDPNMGCY